MDTSKINEIVEKNAGDSQQSGQNAGEQNQQQNEGGDNQSSGDSTESQNDDSSSQQQGGGEEGQKQTAGDNQQQTQSSDELTKLLKDLNLTSVDELKEKLANTKDADLTPEEKEKAQAVYEASLQKFAVEEGKMKIEDFHQLKTLQSKKDADLVFEGYLNDFKEENLKSFEEDYPNLSEAEIQEELAKEAKAEFEKEYGLNAKSEKAKQRAAKRLEIEAGQIREPLVSSYNEIKSKFDTESELRKEFPKFAKEIESVSSSLVPEKVDWFTGKDGEEDIPVEIELSTEERAEIIAELKKRLETPGMYEVFKSGDKDKVKKIAEEQAEFLILKKLKVVGSSRIAEIFLGRGTKKGSTAGAEQRFETNQSKASAQSTDTKSSTEKEKEVLNQFGKK